MECQCVCACWPRKIRHKKYGSVPASRNQKKNPPRPLGRCGNKTIGLTATGYNQPANKPPATPGAVFLFFLFSLLFSLPTSRRVPPSSPPPGPGPWKRPPAALGPPKKSKPGGPPPPPCRVIAQSTRQISRFPGPGPPPPPPPFVGQPTPSPPHGYPA